MMKEIKLKLIYIVALLLFILINTHALLWSIKIFRPLSNTEYVISPKLVETCFPMMVVCTLIMGIGNIFFIKRVGRENAYFFLGMMVFDTILIISMVIITITVYNVKEKELAGIYDLMNGTLLIGLYGLKQTLFVYLYNKNAKKKADS